MEARGHRGVPGQAGFGTINNKMAYFFMCCATSATAQNQQEVK
jgi:hypothetical protein